MELIHLGYRIAFNGNKAHNYKLVYEGKRYLIYDLREVYSNELTWVTILEFENRTKKFDDHSLSEEAVKVIIRFLPTATKNDVEINGDEDNDINFFEPDEVSDEDLDYVKPIGVWTGDEVNDMLSVFSELDGTNDGNETLITKEIANFAREDYGYRLLDELVGYTVTCIVEGDHRNDGQMVDYTFIFTSPTDVVTQLDTEMCLMVGWNYWDELKIQ